jgi:hypothetical protein
MRHAQAAQAAAVAQHQTVMDQTRILGQTIVVIQILADVVYKARDFQADQASDIIDFQKIVIKVVAVVVQAALGLVVKMIHTKA